MAQSQPKTAEASIEDLKPALTKLSLELGPLVVFFIVNAQGENILEAFPTLQTWFSQPIIFATAVFMVAMAISLVLSKLILKTIPVMPLVTGVVVLVFGGMTLYFQDALFIKLKPTITNVLFGSVLLGGLAFGHSLLRYVFGEVYKLQDRGWYLMTLRWGIFFFVLAALNEIVWRNFSDDFWVAFKVWGIMPLTMAFAMSQLPLLNKYAPNDEPAASPVKAAAEGAQTET
ncbi:septation protein A [Pelagibacterium halotolerans]|uniref:Inner membrane-spanning protein YciB n=1 Tax=Pelagibacterium halotolerans (strain DSM 22347 / JCM 15775 / CGMCC 1.7692 / B2) TaxID=1082931 RepID=G4R703_PELHB|nr:septation protein A [Pelagibacterium halotolerans]AEQ53276.1 putative intracellular septation protein [Pelagibacterium halotolerans B2]QJR17104.1 septation protein A [Pelagibacterium halotolerans]SEA97015.1 intracellular septation protein [Pelagibacterium halotolerans]